MNKLIFLLLLLCSVAAFGQKSVHVARYLGDIRYQSAPPAGQVKFAFERAVLLRTSDGQKTYAQILRDAPQFSDSDNAGGLLGIQVNGETVMPEGKKEGAAAAVVPTLPEQSGKTFWQDVPDSSKLEEYKREMLEGKAKFGKELAPRQEFLFWMYRRFAMPILFLFALIGWLIAKSAYNESRYDLSGFVIFGNRIADVGHLARYFVFGVAGICFLIEIVNMAVREFFVSDNLYWWLFKTIAIGIVFYFVFTRWIVPNPRVTDTMHNQQGNNFPRLNR